MINDRVSRARAGGRKPAAGGAQPRRRPQQSRSRKRVGTILAAARRLIGTRGNDAVSVREIAATAGVPISSVYQYFPDKNAIVRELIASHLATVRERVAKAFGRVRGPEDLPRACQAALTGLVASFSQDPTLPIIWAAVQANTVLSELDAQDSREIAAHLAQVFTRVLSGIPRPEIDGICLFAAHVPSSAVRVALTLDPRSRRRLLAELRRVVQLRMSDLIARSGRAKRKGGAEGAGRRRPGRASRRASGA